MKVERKTDIQIDSGSFQDRESRVFYHDNRVFRALSEDALKNWQALQHTKFYQRLVSEGKVVSSREVDNGQEFGQVLFEGRDSGFLEHQRISAISYPYEWCFGMLKDAALLHLDILLDALEEGFSLKDASSFNVQWNGVRPVFIDIASFEALKPGPWVGYRQFCQMFLYPLLLQAYKNVSYHPWLRGSIQGIEPMDFCRLMSPQDYLKPGVFLHGYLHAKLQNDFGRKATDESVASQLRSAEYSRQMIRNNLQGLKKIIERLNWDIGRSTWSDYTTNNSYTSQETQEKIDFISETLQNGSWGLVWDIGCNTGNFSKLASQHADYVLAMDNDHFTVEKMYARLKQEKITNVLPLVYNLADPSPSLGWRGKERKSLEHRNKPDLVLCLALIHHMVIQYNIPVREFLEWLAQLGGNLVIEFVEKSDPMVKRLLANKIDNYDDYERGYFERCLGELFNVEKSQALQGGTRTLYYCSTR